MVHCATKGRDSRINSLADHFQSFDTQVEFLRKALGLSYGTVQFSCVLTKLVLEPLHWLLPGRDLRLKFLEGQGEIRES